MAKRAPRNLNQFARLPDEAGQFISHRARSES